MLGKMQIEIDKLNKKLTKAKDAIAKYKQDLSVTKAAFNRYKREVETKIERVVDKEVQKVKAHYEEELAKKDKRIFELECRLNINSETSSLPSSKDPIYKDNKKEDDENKDDDDQDSDSQNNRKNIQNSREKTNRSIGGQTGHKKSSLSKFKNEEITKEVIHKENKCPFCGCKDLVIIKFKERDEYNLKIIVEKTRHKIAIQKCSKCGKIIKVTIPDNLHAENQYGSFIQALISIFYNYGFISLNRIRYILSAITNGEINPSEGYMVKLQKRASKKLKDFVFDASENLKKSKLLHWDDTVVHIADKPKACFRGYSNTKIVLFKAHMAKDKAGINEDGILQNLSEDAIVVHDHLLLNYSDEYSYQNAECNAHINRKLKGISVNTQHNWSIKMEKLLKDTFNKRKAIIDNEVANHPNEKLDKYTSSFSETQIKEIFDKYDELLTLGFKEYKEFQHKYEYKNEENLLEFLRDFKENILFWVKDFNVPYTNNHLEQLIRMIKTKMKISYQFKSLEQAEYFANIRSYTETCGNFGINKAIALKRLFEGNPYSIGELFQL